MYTSKTAGIELNGQVGDQADPPHHVYCKMLAVPYFERRVPKRLCFNYMEILTLFNLTRQFKYVFILILGGTGQSFLNSASPTPTKIVTFALEAG